MLSILAASTFLIGLCTLATGNPAGAQQAGAQTDWSYQDEPELNGPPMYWWAGAEDAGYGSNNFVFTYGSNGAPAPDNWAVWEMGTRIGVQEVAVYVPSNNATATVRYKIYTDGRLFAVASVAQADHSGWVTIGRWVFDGADVEIRAYDNEAAEHWERDGYFASMIGIDATRMRCVRDCSSTAVESVQPPSVPRGVVVVPHRERQLRVMWSAPEDSGSSPVDHYRVQYSRPGWASRVYEFEGLVDYSPKLEPDTLYEVSVVAVNEEGGMSAAATVLARTSSPGAPSVPRGAVVVPHRERQLRVMWSAPEDWGSSPVDHYRVQYSRPGWASRVYEFEGLVDYSPKLEPDTLYEVSVVAVNEDGGMSAAATVLARTSSPGAPSVPRGVVVVPHRERQLRVMWSAPEDWGSSPVDHYRVQYSRPGWASRVYEFEGLVDYSPKLEPDTSYTVTVVAVGEDGSVSPSVTVTGTTAPVLEADG